MNCGLCGSTKNVMFLTTECQRLVKCKECGLIYTDSFGKSQSYAEEDYFTRKNQYVSRWNEFCAIFESLIDKIVCFKSSGKLLDVGAGVGTLLYVAAKRGFTVQGVEVSEWASAFAREEKGLDVITGTLENTRLETEAFDVIVINHVLEHVDNPRKLLTEVHRLLKNDGLLVIGVPNIGSLMAFLLGSKWQSLRPEEHVWHFSPATLKRLARESGFTELRFESRENYSVTSWRPKALLIRIINCVSVLTGRSEAMLLFATKKNTLTS